MLKMTLSHKPTVVNSMTQGDGSIKRIETNSAESRTAPHQPPAQGDLFKLLFLPEGEHFIMDTEQLVSRPYHDMQRDNTYADEGRRASLSEKLINVRNKVCNNHLINDKKRLDKEESTSLRGMHETSSKLRYDVKLLDLDRRRHTVEVNKRLQPSKDYSYDDQQLLTSQKRLGVAGPCYYLQKAMRYPVRHSGLQQTVTPTLAKARKTLQRYKFELMTSTPGLSVKNSLSRSSSKCQTSAQLETPSERGQIQGIERKSLSAGSSERHNRKWAFLTQSEETTDVSVQANDQTLGKSLPHLSESTGSLVILPNSPHQRPSAHKVKFAFPKKVKSYAKLDAHILARSKTFHQGMDTKPIRSCYIRESEDEDPPPRKVDLQALLFGKPPAQSRPSTQASSLGKRKRSMLNTPGHLTQEMMEKESATIQRKINAFLNKVETWDPTVRFDSGSSSDEDDTPAPYVPRAHVTPFSRHFLSQMAEEKKNEDKKIEEMKTEGNLKKLSDGNQENAGNNNDREHQDFKNEVLDENEDSKAKPLATDKWKAVVWRVTKPNLSQAKQLSTEDLVLQRMMGIDVSKRQRRKSGVPLHSAGRALRHTPTFKMQKVVEDLMSGRTKFQQFEVDSLKKQLESGVDITQLEQTSDQPDGQAKGPPGETRFLPNQLSDTSDEEEDEEERRDDKVTMMTKK